MNDINLSDNKPKIDHLKLNNSHPNINEDECNDSNEKNQLIKSLQILVPLRNIFIKLFDSFDSFFLKYVRKKRFRNITSLEFLLFIVCLVFYIITLLNIAKSKGYYSLDPIDIMTRIFRNSSLLRRKITCSESVYFDNKDKQFSKLKSEKYKLFNQFYLFNLEKSPNEINIFDLNFKEYLKADDEPEMIDLLHKLKFCTIETFEKNFNSQSIFNSTDFNFKRLLRKKRMIQSLKKIKFLSTYNNLKPGGYYKPPLCFQEYLYYHTNDQTLLKLKDMVDIFKSQPTSKLDMFIKQLSEFTYGIVREHFNSFVHKNKILKFVKSKEKDLTVIVIPYLNRENNLVDLMYNLHPFLQRQFIHYKILVVEQANPSDSWNKGRLYNSAFDYLLKNYRVQNLNDEFYPNSAEKDDLNVNCMIFHDVDLIPESDYNIYGCGDEFVMNYNDDMPRHLSLTIRSENENNNTKESFAYKTNLYEYLVGGVLCIKPKVYYQMNGFSNEYWNWGAEDDDLSFRMLVKEVCLTRPRDNYALYRMFKHKETERNNLRYQVLESSIKRIDADGLNNFRNLNLSIVSQNHLPFYTHIKAYIGKPSLNYFKNLSAIYEND